MLDDKKIKEIQKLIPQLVNEGILDKNKDHTKLIDFFLETAEKSLNAAKLLLKVSTDPKLMDTIGFPDFDGYLWVINATYYSMFYMANAALAHAKIKIKTEIGVHKLTFQALVYYFYLTNRLAKKYVEEFLQAQEDSEELLGREELLRKAERKAKELILHYNYEQDKRKTFTYELERKKIEVKSKVSLERAANFFKEIEWIIKE